MAKLRMADASTQGGRKPHGPITHPQYIYDNYPHPNTWVHIMITLHVHTQTLIIIITISTTCAWEQEQGGKD